MGLILASISPRRSELLSKIRKNFKVLPSNVKEEYDSSSPPEVIAMDLAESKAQNIFLNFKDNILAADTIVVLDGKILGKPVSRAHAKAMLKSLSGKSHEVITGVCYLTKKEIKKQYCKTTVVFNELSSELIDRYINSGMPFDKAGSYGIQDPYPLVREYKGSFSNVVGLPLELVEQMMREE